MTPSNTQTREDYRTVTRTITATALLEGAGFPVLRPFPVAGGPMQFDPFLLLDHMGPVEWAPGTALGAPDHPHRGFETVTYLLSGRMQHRDSQGYQGELGPGDAQWMTAGSGIVHSEMPHPEFAREGGVLHGFQLWVNLPAMDKMATPRYQDIPAVRIPRVRSSDGQTEVRVIAGESMGASAVIATRTPITYLHFILQPGAAFEQTLPKAHNAFAYVFSGTARIGERETEVREGQAALLDEGSHVRLSARGNGEVELLLLAGAPLNEPMARRGPFVMNTEDEIIQAFKDYREGTLTNGNGEHHG